MHSKRNRFFGRFTKYIKLLELWMLCLPIILTLACSPNKMSYSQRVPQRSYKDSEVSSQSKPIGPMRWVVRKTNKKPQREIPYLENFSYTVIPKAKKKKAVAEYTPEKTLKLPRSGLSIKPEYKEREPKTKTFGPNPKTNSKVPEFLQTASQLWCLREEKVLQWEILPAQNWYLQSESHSHSWNLEKEK